MQSALTRDAREHSWTDLFTVVESKNDVGPAISGENFVGACLALDPPADAKERGENRSRLSGTPDAHTATVNT